MALPKARINLLIVAACDARIEVSHYVHYTRRAGLDSDRNGEGGVRSQRSHASAFALDAKLPTSGRKNATIWNSYWKVGTNRNRRHHFFCFFFLLILSFATFLLRTRKIMTPLRRLVRQVTENDEPEHI